MRKGRIVFILLAIGIWFFPVQCRQKKKDDVSSELISSFLSQGNPLDAACQRFILSEANCVAVPDSSVVSCPTLISNLKREILPEDKVSDAVAILYFNCFSEANLLYNAGKACGKSSFNSSSQYRTTQRSGGQNAEITWKDAFDKCASLENKTPTPGSELANSGTTLARDPFE